MQIKKFWLQWKDATPVERKARFLECEKIMNEQVIIYNNNPKSVNPFKTNNFGELLALESLCGNDALSVATVYHEDKWINELISGRFGETPTEAYENVEKLLSKIDGIVIHSKQERSNSNIVFNVITKYCTYTYETRYHFVDGGCVVALHCLNRSKRQPTTVEWLMYMYDLTKEQAEARVNRNKEFEDKFGVNPEYYGDFYK